jgi:hypothetical protein
MLAELVDQCTEKPSGAEVEAATAAWRAARDLRADTARALLAEALERGRWLSAEAIRAAMVRAVFGDRGDRAVREVLERVVQLELGTAYEQARPGGARQLRAELERRRADVLAGGDPEDLVRWASAEVPWLGRALGDVPEPPRRVWTPPPPPVPAPTPAHAAVAARIVRAGGSA